MAFTYDPATDAGKVRLLIADTDSVDFIFTDAEIAAFLSMEEDSIRFAAADALDAIASSRARLAKKIKSLDMEADFTDAASNFREQAKAFREIGDDDGSFQIAELVTNHFSARERLEKQFQRGAI